MVCVFVFCFFWQVVDRDDDDAWGLSVALPVGVAAASREGGSSGTSAVWKLALVIGVCAGGTGIAFFLVV